MHLVSAVSQGADGVRLIDANHDGLPDITTPWEEGGKITVSLHPGSDAVREEWPTKIIAEVPSPEDSVWADLNGDGIYEVITCAEGKERSLWVHWNRGGGPLGEWISEPFPQLRNTQQWMYCLPAQVDGRYGTDLILGSKGDNASIIWLEAPPQSFASELSEWKVRKICDAGWTMSLVPVNNKIGVLSDLFVTDRKKETKAAKRFESVLGAVGYTVADWRRTQPFSEEIIGSTDQEPMFMDLADLDQDGLLDVVLATYSDEIDVHRQARQGWKFTAESWTIKMPPNTGTGKSVGIGDIDLDGDMDIAFTCGNSEGKHGVMWLSYRESPKETEWAAHDIGGLTGTKFDRLELIDLDNDGDLDLLTCEEKENLGVIWYENPIHP